MSALSFKTGTAFRVIATLMRAANLALSVTEIREAEDRYIAKGSPPPAERTGFVKLHLTTWQLGDVGRDPPRVLRRQRDEGG